jgi:hypothetical protein
MSELILDSHWAIWRELAQVILLVVLRFNFSFFLDFSLSCDLVFVLHSIKPNLGF